MQPVIKERQYQGTIDPVQHWQEEAKRHEGKDDAVSKVWVKYAYEQLKRWEKKQGRG